MIVRASLLEFLGYGTEETQVDETQRYFMGSLKHCLSISIDF
jgi:hypothetical protein